MIRVALLCCFLDRFIPLVFLRRIRLGGFVSFSVCGRHWWSDDRSLRALSFTNPNDNARV